MSAVVEPKTGRILAWKDSIPLRYQYTAGTAGESFLRGLKEGRLIASKCTRCGEVRIPPRTYCLVCYGRTNLGLELFQLGCVASVSTPRQTQRTTATTFGFVTFEGVSGGLVHKMLRVDRLPRPGETVRPVFAKPEKRAGSILDLEGFRTALQG